MRKDFAVPKSHCEQSSLHLFCCCGPVGSEICLSWCASKYLLLETKTLILKKLSASAIWFCLSNCATSSKRHPKWPSTSLSVSAFPLYCGGLHHCKAGWHGCVGFRYVVLERQEAGKMRNNETEQGEVQEQWSRKIRSSNSFCWRLSDF